MHPQPRMQNKTSIRVSHHGHTGNHPAFPAQWFYGLLRATPGYQACLTPSPALLSADLTPASGRQNDTTSPYASRPRSSRALPTSIASRLAFVTCARPSEEAGPNRYSADFTWPSSEISEIPKLKITGIRRAISHVSVVPRRGTSQLSFSCLSWKSPAKLPAIVSQDRRLPALAKARSERVEDAALWAVLLQNPAASDRLTKCRNVLNRLTIYWGMV